MTCAWTLDATGCDKQIHEQHASTCMSGDDVWARAAASSESDQPVMSKPYN